MTEQIQQYNDKSARELAGDKPILAPSIAVYFCIGPCMANPAAAPKDITLCVWSKRGIGSKEALLLKKFVQYQLPDSGLPADFVGTEVEILRY